jgi:hypothetical protein
MKIRLVLPLLAVAVVRTAMAQSPGTFTATGRMTTERLEHTATLLTTGRVLIAGGTANTTSALASAELYDPSTGTFAPTGDMTRTRLHHTATLLPNGKVLIAAGISYYDFPSFDTASASAELYDPLTGTFAATGDMTTARFYHTATLLNNGKVLIAGGNTNGVDLLAGGVPISRLLASAELYDPSTATFTAIGNMTSRRDLHTATLLSNGKVLIDGSGEGLTPASELYDPDTATFSLVTNGPLRGYWDKATLLTNGKVLFASGNDTFGGIAAALYDPSTGTFTDTGNMTSSRSAPETATLLPDGKVLIAGLGSDPTTGQAAHNSELYDLGTGTFSPTGDMATSRTSHTATLLPDGTVLISGGWTSHGTIASAEIYHPAVLVPAPALLSLSGDGKGPGAIQHANTYQAVSAANPAVAGEALVVYCTGLADGSVIPPQVMIGGQRAEVLWFGNTPGFVGLNQINVRLPTGIAPGPAVPVRLNYLGRPTNEVTIGVR